MHFVTANLLLSVTDSVIVLSVCAAHWATKLDLGKSMSCYQL